MKYILFVLLAIMPVKSFSDSNVSRLERDVIVLHKKLNALSYKLDTIDSSQTNSSSFVMQDTAGLNARVESLEERIRSIQGEKQMTSYRLNNNKIALSNFSQSYDKKLADQYDKLDQVNKDYVIYKDSSSRDISKLFEKTNKLGEVLGLLNTKIDKTNSQIIGLTSKLKIFEKDHEQLKNTLEETLLINKSLEKKLEDMASKSKADKNKETTKKQAPEKSQEKTKSENNNS